ncbi:D-alanyl-D-alanine carboxypeptidase [Kytococcus aerolatus]|uniref:D-alanyl-D-alanine carboxypeptidase n=1 Tax=Kytococcus aerolatus TaxID=592308 RepID=A0A212U1D3_9MICO|nr:serine hydrolase domain-containing protein [Kytococcus aerolatus]SNC72043.1 D-alanyl-D-alanine carboxypeptidase [Kytococcus aerolatus]
MTTDLSRRSFSALTAAGATSAALAGAAGTAAHAVGPSANLASTPGADALQSSMDAMNGNPLHGSMVSVRGSYGFVDLASGQQSRAFRNAIRVNFRARISSITKPMVATVVMQEVERGTWTLDSTLDQFLPGLWPGRGKVTIGQLLNHTSGMPCHLNDFMTAANPTGQVIKAVTDNRYTHADHVAQAQRYEWKFEPGEGWAYSNTGYVVLSMLLEKVTGTEIGALLRQRIFDKGLNQTRLYNSRRVDFEEIEDYHLEGDQEVRLNDLDMSIFSGSGGATATAADLTDFHHLLMKGHLVSQDTVDQMLTPVGAAVEAGYGYGVFWIDDVWSGSGKLFGHDGGGFGSTALSLTSRDGRRRVSLTFAGRAFDEDGFTATQEGMAKVLANAFAISNGTAAGRVRVLSSAGATSRAFHADARTRIG